MVLAEYLASGRALSRRYLDVWFRHPEWARGCEGRCVNALAVVRAGRKPWSTTCLGVISLRKRDA